MTEETVEKIKKNLIWFFRNYRTKNSKKMKKKVEL